MITRRIVANLVVFFAASALLIGYAAVTLFGNPLRDPRTVVAQLPEAGGLRPGFTASHDGVVVGTVSGVELADGGVEVTVELDPRTTVPANVEAKVIRASAVGEQRLELVSVGEPTDEVLPDGATVPTADDPIPPDVAEVLETVEELLAALPAEDLNTVVHELAVGVDGRADDLKAITRALDQIGADVIELDPELRALLARSPQVLDELTAMSPEVHDALDNTEALTQILEERDDDIVELLGNASDLAVIGSEVVLEDRDALTCLIGNVEQIGGELQGEALADLDRALEINDLFFGAIDRVAKRGESADVGYGPGPGRCPVAADTAAAAARVAGRRPLRPAPRPPVGDRRPALRRAHVDGRRRPPVGDRRA